MKTFQVVFKEGYEVRARDEEEAILKAKLEMIREFFQNQGERFSHEVYPLKDDPEERRTFSEGGRTHQWTFNEMVEWFELEEKAYTARVLWNKASNQPAPTVGI